VPCSDKSGEHIYEAELLWEGGRNLGLTPQKIAEIWRQAKDFDVLFSDETNGKFEPFFYALINPSSIWFELRRVGEPTSIGLAYFTNIIPGFDMHGHFTFWDSIARGREPILLFLAEWVADRYKIRRITAHVPPYQAGVVRFLRNLGFIPEGEMREAVKYKDRWWPLLTFGMTRKDLDRSMRALY